MLLRTRFSQLLSHIFEGEPSLFGGGGGETGVENESLDCTRLCATTVMRIIKFLVAKKRELCRGIF